jgi:excisionase family DNA binding protein
MTRDPNEVEPGRNYTVDEVAYYMRMTPRLVVKEIRRGFLDGMRFGRHYRIKGRALLAYENQGLKNAEDWSIRVGAST